MMSVEHEVADDLSEFLHVAGLESTPATKERDFQGRKIYKVRFIARDLHQGVIRVFAPNCIEVDDEGSKQFDDFFEVRRYFSSKYLTTVNSNCE
jgi:hypothetical protein